MSSILYFWGNDPARDADYHTFVIQGLDTSRPDDPPRLKDVFRFKSADYLDILNWLFVKPFKSMPPTKFYTDATRDPTWAEILTKKLGVNVVNSFKYTQDSKLKLKVTARQYLQAGYTFPDADILESQQKITAEKAHWIREIKAESLREQMKPTSGDKISFDHGGKHNDLNAGFELSLQAVYDYQKGNFGQHGNEIEFGGGGEDYGDSQENTVVNSLMNRFSNYSNDVNVKVTYGS